jgi:hypothetical protein
MEPKQYIINKKTYYQKPLVLGQIDPLVKLIENVTLTELSAYGLVSALGDKLPKAIAIIITPEGQKVSEKNLAELEREFTDEIDIDTALTVAADFLSCNPISSVSRMMAQMVMKILGTIKMSKTDGSTAL